MTVKKPRSPEGVGAGQIPLPWEGILKQSGVFKCNILFKNRLFENVFFSRTLRGDIGGARFCLPARPNHDKQLLSFGKQFIHFGNHFKSVGHIKNIGLALRPATVWIKADGAAFVDETPADGVRFLAVAAGRQAFRVARCGTGLTDLVEVAHETDHFPTLARLVNQ